MQLNVSAEVILSQLGYSRSDASLQQAEKIIGLTDNFDKFSKHIFTLNDHLKKMNAYVGLSNKSNYLKIKCDENDSDEILQEFHEEVSHWANKHNVKLQKLDSKHIYYILGTTH
jgi:tRNA U34 5-carboxymethylaminomethyl modifying GTPase MnmE/TrmE